MRLAILTPLLLVAGCSTATLTSGDAICTATQKARADHAQALAASLDDRAVISGANLIETIDAACAK